MQQLALPLLLVLVLGATLFMGSRKQKKVQQAQKDLQDSIQPGDRVMTTSGLYGTVADASSDSTIDIEIAPGVITTWLRLAVREKVQPEVEETEDEVVAEESSIIESSAGIEEQKSTAQVAEPLEHGKK
ncbi:preprotein translocase subunit YajC [Amycolatopsis xylanica]|uniref:Preprotein translocase subunit YajC n=1 Tax=Amycolatopsis xylanica TaxID=589385 RepID=A0A1H2STK1_9PSEU|nr:preprotein translocase subunit YajC [Amycolatopsis xylanica]SDW34910.1 preprotein translocase subunit YajC [Amycolatopsis xylanica]